MSEAHISYFYERASDKKDPGLVSGKSTFGPYQGNQAMDIAAAMKSFGGNGNYLNTMGMGGALGDPMAESSSSSFGMNQDTSMKSFDESFGELCEKYKKDRGIDIKRNIQPMLSDGAFMEQYKQDLMGPVFEAWRAKIPGDPHIESIIENVKNFWDTKVKSYSESAGQNLSDLLPIATLEFPVLVKQFFATIMNDIIEVRTVKTPNITKHVRTLFAVNNQTGEEMEYPKCIFTGQWKQMMDAATGYPIKEDVVNFDNGRLYRFDIISKLTEGNPRLDRLTWDIKIIGIKVNGETIYLRGNGITFEFSTGGTLVNGRIDMIHEGTHIVDTLMGQINLREGTIDLASAAGVVEGVVFSGRLSNENNLRTVSVREKRDILRYTIADGPRYQMPFTIEEIEDAAALLDINYYNRMVDELVKLQEIHECMDVIQFLNDEFKKFDGVNTDAFNMESTVKTYTVNILPPRGYAGDPFEYMSKAIQFKLKAIIHNMANITKLEGLSYIIAGNDMACQLLAPFTGWKIQSGESIGGISVNRNYGIATDMGANIRVVGSNLFDPYTVDPVQSKDENGELRSQRELVLHGFVYPTDAEHVSYEHLKYTSHLMTSESQTAYQYPGNPGGAYKLVTMTSRFKNIVVQGLQFRLILLNSDKVYGDAPVRPPITGAPWDSSVAPVSSMG